MLRSAKRLLPTQRSGSRPFQSHHRLLSSLAFMGWEISNFSSHSVEIANQDHILWHRNTHNCTENLLHWMFCMLYPSQKKDQNCLPPNLFINSSILQPSTQLLQDQDPLKPYQDRYLPVTGRGRPHPGFFSHSLLQRDNSICSAKDVDLFLCIILLTVIISKVTDGQCVWTRVWFKKDLVGKKGSLSTAEVRFS